MSSESDTSQAAEARCMKAVTQFDQVIYAIRALGNRSGSTRDEICDFLVSRDLMNARISKALVAKALYKGINEGLVRRPKGTNQYMLTDKKHPRRSKQSPRKSDTDKKHASKRSHGTDHGHHHKSHKSDKSHRSQKSHKHHK